MADKNISKVKLSGITYNIKDSELQTKVTTLETNKQDKLTPGANITIVDNVISAASGSNYGDDDVKSLLAGKTVATVELNPDSSKISAQAVEATDNVVSESYGLAFYENGQFSDPIGGLYVQSGDQGGYIITVGGSEANTKAALSGTAARPIYYNASTKASTDIALTTDYSGTADDGNWTSLTINGVTASIPQGSTAYTGGTGIDVDNDNYTISVDDSVVTVSKLASGELQAIDLDPKSSHVISQVVTAIEGLIGPAVVLYTTDPETGALNPTQYGTFGVQTDGLEHPIVGLTANTEDAQLVLGSYQERPYYFNLETNEFHELAFKNEATKVIGNPTTTATAALQKVQIGDTIYTVGTELTKAKLISVLGYTPYDEANPRNFLSALTYADITTALGFIPYNSTNPNGYITGITGDDVRIALGYTPYDSTNPNGYITGISKSDVTAALGYTPYSSTNPSGYITKTVSDLNNYYTKSVIDGMIGQGLQTKIVSALPTTAIKTNIIYLVPLVSGQDGYTQWMYIENKWETLGTTNINLSEYAKSAELADVAKSGSYTSLLDKPEIPTDLGDLTNTAGYAKNDTTALVNYTKTSDLATVAITGSYNDLTNKPAIPTTLGALTNDVNYVTANDLAHVNVSTFVNDVNYAKLSDIQALQELDVDAIKEAIAITENVGTIKGVTAGSGLIGGGETGKVTLGHSNNITAKTAYGSTETSVVSGGSFTVTDIKYDENGHITASQDRSITIPEIPNVTGMLTTSNYSDTLDSVYQAKGNYQAAGDYLTPTNVVNDNTGNYVVNVTQDTRGQITVTKGALPSITVIDDASPATPTTDTVDVVANLTSANQAITEHKVKVVTQTYIDNLVGDINSILDRINGEVI